ncbi:MAG: peptide chain release factor N(5)-glutamine methyltransferase [Pseudomonadales bacterium]|nr:peptide chain release factor N(5)-glutamine methyltransferase [Pseudomonadales bacterium]
MTANHDNSGQPMPSREQLLLAGCARLRGQSACGATDVELLLAHVLGLTRAQLRLDPLAPVGIVAHDRFLALLARRLAGEPFAYLTGHREFWSLPIVVTPDVLVPRPDTELLVERALELCGIDNAEIVDLGTGSGAIALALANERPLWRVTAVDRSAAAIEVAKLNARKIGIEQIEWRVGNWFEPLLARRFDLIVSNPPYVRDDDVALASDGLRFEPQLALRGGPDGLDPMRILCKLAPQHLRPGGVIALEHGSDQSSQVCELLVESGFINVRSHPDLADLPRVTEAVWPG